MPEFTLDDYRQLIVKTLASPYFSRPRRSLKGQIRLRALKRHFRRICAAIDSMTPEERADPARVIDARRGRRIAAGSGVPLPEIRKLVRGFPRFVAIVERMRRISRRGSE
jgi:signal recognition particle GTPase